MTEIAQARELLDAVIGAFAVLGGTMAYFSGWAASAAQASGEHPAMLGDHINEGVADGFRAGVPLALVALIIVVWS